MKSITDWMLSEKLATHWKQAENIIRGLKLGDLYNAKQFDEIRKRTRLYRDWRNSGVYGKLAQPCYEKAIAGEPAPAPLLEGVLHSEAQPEQGGEGDT